MMEPAEDWYLLDAAYRLPRPELWLRHYHSPSCVAK
jgi:hypothetical protein